MYKKRIRFCQYLLIIFFGCIFSMIIEKRVFASQESVTKLLVNNKYTEYDITNDTKKDIIEFKRLEKDDIMFKKFQVYINGKCALTIKPQCEYYFAKIQIMTLSNDKSYLFVHLGGDNNDGPADIYKYKRGKLIKKVDLIKSIDQIMGYHSYANISKIKGNKIYVNMISMSYGVAHLEYEAIYRYKSGNLVINSKKHKILGYYDGKHTKTGIYTLTSIKPIQLYKFPSLKEKSGKLESGTKIKIKWCFISGKKISFYIEAANGKKGWFKSPKSAINPFKEIMYAG